MKKYEFVKQDNLKDCGVASLAMIIKYYKGFVPKEKLREMTKTNKNGTTAYHLIETAKEIGFESYGIKCELDDIEKNKIKLPVIAYTVINNSYKHFVVIYKLDLNNKKIIIADPMNKIKNMNINEFNKIFKNVVIVIYPIHSVIKYNCNNSFLKKLLNLYVKNTKSILLIVLFSAFFIILNFINLIILKEMLNNKNIYLLFFICIFLFIIKEIINFIRNKIILKLNKKINFKLTTEVFSHIINLPYNFYRNRTTGEIISRLHDLESAKEFAGNILINISINIIVVISSSIFLYIINKTLFIISLLTLLFYLINNKIFKNKINKKIDLIKTKKEIVDSYMIESITGFETIKGLNLEKNFVKKFNNIYREYINNLEKYHKICNVENIFKNLTTDIGFLLIIFIGVILINEKVITIQELLIFNTLLSYFLTPIKDIFENSSSLKEMIISMRRISDLYYDKLEIVSNEKIKEIEMKNLNYSHNDIDDILKNINLKILNNEKIMITGKSGCGKSTLLKLIKKYYKNENVYINNTKDKHKKILYVSQNEYLFTDTLYNNIVLNRKIDKKHFDNIIKICSIESIIKDKNIGYDMLIEENGFNISGGEKQRIILARTLLTNFDVLLLDESLSEMDINLERKIIKNILKKFNKKTIILVSHRINNLDLFNKMFKITDSKLEIVKRRDENV